MTQTLIEMLAEAVDPLEWANVNDMLTRREGAPLRLHGEKLRAEQIARAKRVGAALADWLDPDPNASRGEYMTCCERTAAILRSTLEESE